MFNNSTNSANLLDYGYTIIFIKFIFEKIITLKNFCLVNFEFIRIMGNNEIRIM